MVFVFLPIKGGEPAIIRKREEVHRMFFVFFLLWVAFNGRLTWEIAAFGAVLSGVLYAFCCAFLGYSPKKDWAAARLIPAALRYVGLLLTEIVKCNLALTRIVFAPKLEVKPHLVTFRTPLKGGFKSALADSITLTPGTITVHSEGDRLTTIKAAVHLANENLAIPLLVGDRAKINTLLKDNHLTLDPKCIVDFRSDREEARRSRYAALLYNKVSRKGVRMHEAIEYMMRRDWFTLMMVASGDADTSILGYTHRYTEALNPVRQIFTTNSNTTLAAMEIVTTKRGPMFFADTAVNPSPTVEDLVNIVLMAAQTVRNFGIEPVMAMLSHSNFGTDTEPLAAKISKAVEILHFQYPELLVDGEMKADIALNKKARNEIYPFNKLGDREINVLIFPNLSSANISYKMMEILGGAEINGPILMGLNQSCVHLIPEVASTRSIRNLSVIAAAETIQPK